MQYRIKNPRYVAREKIFSFVAVIVENKKRRRLLEIEVERDLYFPLSRIFSAICRRRAFTNKYRERQNSTSIDFIQSRDLLFSLAHRDKLTLSSLHIIPKYIHPRINTLHSKLPKKERVKKKNKQNSRRRRIISYIQFRPRLSFP